MPSVTVECGQLPIVVMTFVGVPGMDQLEASLEVFDGILAARARYVLVMDVTELGMPPGALRRRAARWLIENARAVSECCIGVVCVVTTPLAHAALTAMEWLDPRGQKYFFVHSLDDGMHRARQLLADFPPVADT